MPKLGEKGNPIRIRVQNEFRAQELAVLCEENNWKFICGIEPDYPEDISELEYLLNPKLIKGKKRPKMKQTKAFTIVRDEPKISRNGPCPCGSGMKYKKCCLNG